MKPQQTLKVRARAQSDGCEIHGLIHFGQESSFYKHKRVIGVDFGMWGRGIERLGCKIAPPCACPRVF